MQGTARSYNQGKGDKMTENMIEKTVKYYGKYFDHFEKRYYDHDYRKTARSSFIKYGLNNGGLSHLETMLNKRGYTLGYTK